MSAILTGPRGARRVALIFDTGAALTQIHAATLNRMGYSAKDNIRKATMVGAGGERHEGDLLKSEKIITLGKKVEGGVIGFFPIRPTSRSRNPRTTWVGYY